MNITPIGKLKLHTSLEIEKNAVSIGFECLDREVFDPERCYDILGKSGVKWARCQTGWNRCEKEKGVYTFAWLDSVVDNLLRRGVQPWFNVGFGNPIYMADDLPNPTGVGCAPILYGDEVYTAWKNFVRAMARHYAGRIQHFEIWNEANTRHFWHPGQPDSKLYARMVEETGAIIREEVPGCKIGVDIAGLLHGLPKEGDQIIPYLENFASSLKPGTIDFFSYHCYLFYPEVGNAKNFRYVKQIMEDYGHTNLEYWNGESGHASWYPENYGMFKWKTQGNEHRQAVWQLRRFFLDRDFQAGLSSHFQMVDMWQKPYETTSEVQKKPAAQGILNGITYTPKKSYETLSRLSTVLSGELKSVEHDLEPWYPEDPVEMAALQVIQFTRNGMPTYTYWRPTFIEEEKPTLNGLVIKLNNRGVENPITDPVLIDMLSGEVFEIDKKLYQNNVWVFYGLPMAEYPIMICDRKTYEIEPL